MLEVGAEIDGFCPRCRLNTYQVVSATDGRTIFSATCRTCRNTFAYKPEVSAEELRANQIKKLTKMTRNKLGSPPPVVTSLGRKNGGGNLDGPLKALAALHGREFPVPSGNGREAEGRETAQAAAGTATMAAHSEVRPGSRPAAELPPPQAETTEAPTSGATGPVERWKTLTAQLGWRDGKPYQPTRTYKEGDVVLHKGHGLGIVQSVVHPQACVALFRDTETVLAMGQPNER